MAFFALSFGAMAQAVSDATIAKRENRKGMVLKEWNTPAGDKRAFLDRKTTYDELGRKIEEIEYASYGQKWRIVFEYPKNSDITAKVVREIEKLHTRSHRNEMQVQTDLILESELFLLGCILSFVKSQHE